MDDHDLMMAEAPEDVGLVASRLDNVISLCKRRGFVYPCGEIYGGTRAAWDRIHYADHDLVLTFDGPRRTYARRDGTIAG